MGLPALRDVSLNVRTHEIVGVAGVSGNGQVELAEVLSGLRPATAGRVELGAQDITTFSARDIIDAGVAHIPEDRHTEGSVANMDLTENLILKSYRKPPLARRMLIDWRRAASYAADLVRRFDVKAPGLSTKARMLSGGNLQKLILARELSASPTLIIAVHPTQGLDIGATESVRELLIEQRTAGAAILLISEDLDEVMQLSDRILVLFEGEIMGEVMSEDADRSQGAKLPYRLDFAYHQRSQANGGRQRRQAARHPTLA
jgi:simple sugar transport system ATP-binding protein